MNKMDDVVVRLFLGILSRYGNIMVEMIMDNRVLRVVNYPTSLLKFSDFHWHKQLHT